MQRLLLLACSRRKRPDEGLIAAIERYDGPAFRVLRRYSRGTDDCGLAIYILSAEFGLIHAGKRIPAYDRRMTTERADALRPSITAAARAAIDRHDPARILICAGKVYLRAIEGLRTNPARTSFAKGGQ